MGLTRSYVGASAQEHQWTEDAINGCTFPWERVSLTVEFDFQSEEQLQGANHFDKNRFLFGQTDGPPLLIRLWNKLDTTGEQEFEGKDFFMETVVHELAHALQRTYVTTDDQLSTLAGLYHDYENGRRGQLADWSPSGKVWEDRIIEAFAEFFKDVYLDGRKFDNRTNWLVHEADFTAWLDFVGAHFCAGGGGGDYEVNGTSNMPDPITQITIDARKFRLLNGDNALGFYDPSVVDFSRPWIAVLPHLEPLTRIRDNAESLIDTDNVYWGYDGGGSPVTMEAAGFGHLFTDWPWADPTFISLFGGPGSYSFNLGDPGFGSVGAVNVTIDDALPDPDGVILSIDSAGHIPTTGGAGVEAFVPDAFALRSTGTPFSGLVSIWDSSMRDKIGPAGGLGGDFGGGMLLPLKGACDPLPGTWPYAPHEYNVGSPDQGHVLHHRPVHGTAVN